MSNASSQHLHSLVDQLSSAVAQVERDDLQGLARMHGWCQELAGECEESEGSVRTIAELARRLTAQLEALIFEEIDDAELGLASIRNTIAELGVMMGAAPESGASRPASAANTQVEPEASASEADTPPPPAENDEAAPDAKPAEEEDYEQRPLVLDPAEADFVKGFLEEADEHIAAIEAALLEIERAPDDTDRINDLFRPFHTIKGASGFLNLRDINCLTHEAETLLDQARQGQRSITPGLTDVIFDVVDVLKVQLSSVEQWTSQPDAEPIGLPSIASMIGRLRAIVLGAIDPEAAADGQAARSGRVGERLVEQRSVSRELVDFALGKQKQDHPRRRLGEELIAMKAVTPRQVGKALRPPAPPEPSAQPEAKAKTEQSIRIDTAKLDSLIDMVGELVIAQTQIDANPQTQADPKLNKDVGQVTKIVRDVQELAMAMRMVPIGPTFHKMARLVRDVARKAGKQVDLTISGEDTELDKTVVEQIGDPLVHMVRNAVDHGVESPETREAAGKARGGKVHLSAGHQGGNIVIEISDDGKGLDAEKIRNKAVDRGLIEPDAELTEQQIFQLIFAPGFSMAEKITDISGRGVGMDVVKRNIEQLRGKVEITSEKGCGSTFTIRLPLTLAIIDGMIVRVGREQFVIPTITIDQSLRPRREQITTVQGRGEVLNIRGQLTPLLQLGRLFGLTNHLDPCEAMVVVTYADGQRIGLVVDDLLGQQQVVIKTLGERFQNLRGISGAAILGDGRVGLILEMSGLADVHRMRPPVVHEIFRARPENTGNRTDRTEQIVAQAETSPEAPSESELATNILETQ